MTSPQQPDLSRLSHRVRRRLASTSGKLEYALILVLVACALTLVLSVVHHDTPNVFSNISMSLGT
jgi:Flp pilus assembly pilin Flp